MPQVLMNARTEVVADENANHGADMQDLGQLITSMLRRCIPEVQDMVKDQYKARPSTSV